MTAASFATEFSGEGQTIEFKSGVSGSKLRDAVVAFSNSDGGVVLIGVRDDGRPLGVGGIGEIERHVRDSLDGVHNPGRYETHHLDVDGVDILVLSVSRRREGFSQLHDGAVVVRRGARNERLFGPDLSRFQLQRAFGNFEDTPSPALLADADPVLLGQVIEIFDLEDNADSDVESSLTALGLAERVTGTMSLTVAGALVLLDTPDAVLKRCGVQVLRYRDGEAEPDKRAIITGPVDRVVRHTTAAIMGELGERSVLVGVDRVDVPRLPEIAVREVIANAVAHRSYEANGTFIRVEIRSDSVEVISPGGLLEPVTVEHMRTRQAARNPKVLQYLRRCGLAEDMGLGIDRVEDAMQLDLLDPPQFDESGFAVSAKLFVGSSVSPEERAAVKLLMHDREIASRVTPVVLHAVRHGSVTNSVARDLLRIDSTEALVVLQQLCNEGVLAKEGDRGGARYVPASTLGRVRYERLPIEDQAETVMGLAWEREITNADVRELLGVGRSQALDLLNWLVERGTLERHGERRGVTYGPAQR